MGFRAPRKLYRHPRAKCKGVYWFPRGSKSRRPQGFYRLRYLYCTIQATRVLLFKVFILYYTAGSQSNRCLY